MLQLNWTHRDRVGIARSVLITAARPWRHGTARVRQIQSKTTRCGSLMSHRRRSRHPSALSVWRRRPPEGNTVWFLRVPVCCLCAADNPLGSHMGEGLFWRYTSVRWFNCAASTFGKSTTHVEPKACQTETIWLSPILKTFWLHLVHYGLVEGFS